MSKTCVEAAGLYCGLGMSIPIAPNIAGLGAVIVVRSMLWSKKQTKTWNLCVIMLAAMATFVTLDGSEMSTFLGFWTGITYGTMGQGIITFGRTTAFNTLKERLGKALDAFMGTKS